MPNVLSQLLPDFLKRPLAAYIRSVAQSDPASLRMLETLRPYAPSHAGENSYWVKTAGRQEPNEGLPVPPEELWVGGYGPDAANYLARGKKEVAAMVQILQESGFEVRRCEQILEFGCAAARMLRHVPEFAPEAKLWGVDISAPHIQWCVNNLTPAMHFATTTVIPHLPFEDRYFDLIYCGSVFTHIEDLQQSWLLELARTLRPSGMLFLTIHDEHTVKQLETSESNHWMEKLLQQEPAYASNRNNFDMLVVGRGPASQVFYNSQYLKAILPPCFRWVSHTPGAYGYQSAVVLEKLAPR